MAKPIVLHLGDDIRWNHDQYKKFQDAFDIRRSYSMSRPEFIRALKERQFGDFFAIYRPFWNTGGEMGNWDEELVSLLPNSCKIYASAGAGFDWVDTAALAKKGVIYCNAAAACTESVADAAIWLIISTFRLFSWSHIAARTLDADAFVDANRNLAMVSHNPNGHTLGIIGFGQIGRRTAEKAFLAMNMKIHYHDIVQMPAHLEAISKATYHKSMDSLLAVSDCVMVATPFSGETLLNASLLAKMKTGARLINIARGKLLDEKALVDALRSGKLAAAGLDVHYDEPNVSPELAAMKNVEMMSHNAGASVDSHIGFERLASVACDTPRQPSYLNPPSSFTTPGATAIMSGNQANNWITARQVLEQAIINLRDCIDHREILASSPPVNLDEFEDLSTHIWETRVELAQQIRRFGDARSAAMLVNFYHRLIGTMPNNEGRIP
ncbi:D-isomer specific 2-hydroxyacid dehydrogenase, NAD-binding [Penicillium griseofulvum]|uniref:D-isomer specific 2-hydroxyacid dehydrogenase, NAD-binding n=1 Tax=Penicillium patulum TaxID=5078 RepID=A0A135LTD7_PENPA|nr:D-isomer specific 2-hydroxyacid dehydrogenase, NAD-binding [Penicillium griseofulvum]KXG52225.1 D-isomer specific 2-hydroxyacid dehydrogenase, NAD-binding [Penicillium griseofulvum]